MTKFIINDELYKEAIEPIAQANNFVWIATADIKDMHVRQGSSVVSFLAVLNSLIKKNVAIRILHAKEPGPNFRKSFDKYPRLWESIEMQLCPRVHFKQIVIDGELAYSGSANLTSAGLGMKSKDKRNFESGIVTTDPAFIDSIMKQFDEVWMGGFCKDCKRKEFCPDPIL
ncbi:MAG: phospholipase [Calditrichaeota bacterium]|nr:MAG: phospholipase [Calditrichota bacterium]MBL1205943.1 phospholipase [Calditrichota bacterium]NOG45771.1 phospholipase [Calditrichota bacterium]